MSRFGIQALGINNTLYNGFSGEQISRGRDVLTDQTDGIQYETAQQVMQVKPTADLTTLALKAAIAILGTSGTNGIPVLALDGTNGLVMVGGKAASGGGYATGSVHTARTALNGLLYMAGIRWSPSQRASMALKAMFTSTDGTTDPVTTSLVALPSQGVPGNGFGLSALTINGTTITSVNSLDLSCDPKMEFEFTTGLPMPTGITGAGARGAMGIRLRADIGDADLADGTGAVAMTFSQYANGGGFGSATVTVTLHGNFAYEDTLGGNVPQPIGKNLIVIPTWNGTTLPMTWSVT